MQSDNKRIAKNAIMLTLRSILVAIVSLYTSRVVLETLGVDDYGIYGVVGGILGMVAFLNFSMANATARFITFEIGEGNFQKLKKIVSTALRIHLLIALIVIILGETLGVWFLNYKMVIPPDKIFAANILFQFSVLSVIISFTQVPYSALIMAHEKMSIYAYFEIIFVVLKLAIVYLLLLTENNRLIIYGALTFTVGLINALFYRIYCIKHFSEAKSYKEFDKALAKKMLSFSGFDLYGTMCIVTKNQGQPIVLNLFFGVIANAAASITTTIYTTIYNLTFNIFQAFRPQIIKKFAQNDIGAMSQIMRRSVQFTFLAYATVAIPVLLETPRILYLWLGQIPEYSVPFIRLIIITGFAEIGIAVNNTSIQATGNVKRISFISGSFYLGCLIISYFWLKLGGEAKSMYLINFIMISIVMVIGWRFVKIQIPQINGFTQPIAVLKSMIVVAMVILSSWGVGNLINFKHHIELSSISNLLAILVISLISIIILLLVYPFLALNLEERKFLFNKINYFKNKFHLTKV